ncbi:MAG: hypothetical protein ASARMPREDX12_000974 [Alectoria sarmentosa]|nr:MAG: hypothetical protein ASARMPREDX12_000974 [Alectoria sarmentosa]
MTNTQESAFQFLGLPPELRNRIYANILTATYLVELPEPCVYLHARVRRESPPQQDASPRLAILQVSKMVYQEAKQILYKHSNFLFDLPSQRLPLYQDLSKLPLANLMQHLTIQLALLPSSSEAKRRALHPTTALLRSFSGATILRACCTIGVLFGDDADFLLEPSFLGTLGQLTGFATVVLRLAFMKKYYRGVCRVRSPAYETVDEYLTEGKEKEGKEEKKKEKKEDKKEEQEEKEEGKEEKEKKKKKDEDEEKKEDEETSMRTGGTI